MCENTEEIYKNATRRKRETVVANGRLASRGDNPMKSVVLNS